MQTTRLAMWGMGGRAPHIVTICKGVQGMVHVADGQLNAAFEPKTVVSGTTNHLMQCNLQQQQYDLRAACWTWGMQKCRLLDLLIDAVLTLLMVVQPAVRLIHGCLRHLHQLVLHLRRQHGHFGIRRKLRGARALYGLDVR